MTYKIQKYQEPKFGVINAIRESDQPIEGILKAQNMYYRENEWIKIPGLTELNDTPLSGTIWGITDWRKLDTQEGYIVVASAGKVYKWDRQTKTLTEIHTGMLANQPVEFLQDRGFLYFGSEGNDWKRFDGGNKVYKVGGATQTPLQFRKIIFNPYSQRYFAFKDEFLYWSEHIDNGGIEVWPTSNIQIIESEQGDQPQDIQIFEGRISIFNQNSISTGDVRGVPETWSFQRERSKAGGVAFRTVKRIGNQFYMLSANNEVYAWPEDRFITQGKVKFSIDPSFRHLAVAEVFDDRYYILSFRSGEAVPSDKYHTWLYDTLSDRWFGPSTQRNVVSMFWSKNNNVLLCGGTDDLQGFILEMRGRNIKNKAMQCHIVSSSSDYGRPEIDKRYSKVWLKARQEGSDSGGAGQVEIIINVDNRYDKRHQQTIVLEDPSNQNLSDTGSVRTSLTKRKHIHEANGRGNSVQWEIRHALLNGEFAFSELNIEYILKHFKEDRGV